MKFFFEKKQGDVLMSKINLRDISFRARQWDHPVKGLLKYAEAMKNCGGDIFKLSKKQREQYCLSVLALALQNGSSAEWWTNLPDQDPPDGLVMTLMEEKDKKGHMAHLREIEIVEHRDEPDKLLLTISGKMTENSYEPNTVLCCLILCSATYDLKELSEKLSAITSTIKHIFVVFSGVSIDSGPPSKEQLRALYTVVQLLPVFQTVTFDFRPCLDDYKVRYDKGQESRLIDGSSIYYGTSNPKFLGNKD